ncbi:MAG: aminodeoxychorismate synthase component I [Bacteroidetes bacterium]|nr:aminodeoxychorismate synthase component I [Bacteroidota bacterium]
MTIEEVFDQYLRNDYSALFYTPPIYKNSFSYLFIEPAEIISARNGEELLSSFDLIQQQLKKGRTGFGFITYEAGYYFEKKLSSLAEEDNSTVLQFCFFDEARVKKFKSEELDFVTGGNHKNYNISDFHLNKSKEEFVKDIVRIKEFIEAGETYQVNYTVKGRFHFSGSFANLFKELIFNQSARYSAFINNGKDVIISISPELFFTTKDNKIVTGPMKGTIRRGINNLHDQLNKKMLQSGEKFRAENVMILDLLRNDLGRISEFGSVQVTNLFKIEKYESLFQMISETKSTLRKDTSLKNILMNIFPCGSITGAPKIRTMEIIHELEKEKRGIYTGAIGIIKKDKMIFNIAIRTLIINKESGAGEIGLGSGILWDSDPIDEYDETMLKSKFLMEPEDYFELFETMLVENGKIFLIDWHIERLKDAANYFMFKFNEREIRNKLSGILKETVAGKKYRLKLNLTKWGNCTFTIKEYSPLNEKVKIVISDKKVSSQNRFQYFKTTNRKLYNDEYDKYSKEGFFDVLFFNEKDQLAEGAITNIFIKKKNKWLTPSLDCGILPGVYRKYFICKNQPHIIETQITYEDLLNSEEIILTNSLRGKLKVSQLFTQSNEVKAW